jgi:NTP pyrophosphatase (non-canonical NTP hydrolase)
MERQNSKTFKLKNMNIKEYQKLAKVTLAKVGKQELDILHMYLGIFTECGEVLDIFKKNLAYKKEIDYVNLGEELADICWYVVNLANITGQTLEEPIVDEDYIKYYDSKHLVFKDIISNMEVGEYDTQDVLNLIKTYCNHVNIDFNEILDKNIAKLEVRFRGKFDAYRANNRDLDAERKVLE